MANTTKPNKAQREFIDALQPVLDHWKESVGETYEIKPFSETSVEITRPDCKGLQTMHGLLLDKVSHTCLTRGWTWSVWVHFSGHLFLVVQP